MSQSVGTHQQVANTAGVPQDICLSAAFQILELILIIPVDLSLRAPIPKLGYAPETYASHTWLMDGG